MGGYGVPVVNGIVRGWSVGPGAVAALWGSEKSKEDSGEDAGEIRAKL